MFALFVLCLTFVSATPFVSHFELVDTATGLSVRRMGNHDVISMETNFTIVAAIAGQGNVSRVIFTDPFEREDITAPYSLAGDRPPRRFAAVALKPGYHCLAAYVNSDEASKTTIQFWISDQVAGMNRIPPVGPLPSAIQPASAEPEMPVPPQSDTCKRANISARITKMQPVEGRDDQMKLWVGVDWCTELNDFVRVRLIQYSAFLNETGTRNATTKVLNQVKVKASQLQEPPMLEPFIVNKICSEKFIYVEMCVQNLANGLLCSTTPMRFAGILPNRSPRLKMRPPIELKLAPGDNVTIITEMEDMKNGSEGFSNGGFDITDSVLTVFGVHERMDGDLEMTLQEPTRRLVMNLPFPGTKLTSADDGSLVYVKYVSPRCFGNGSWRTLYSTRILIDETVSSLDEQDKELPTFDAPVYPETPYLEPVELEVFASNPGGGMRADGNSTELQYQWYIRKEDKREKRTFAEAIEGATEAVLKIEHAECDVELCDESGCPAERKYFVDVCNTYGCKRSSAIIPRVLPPTLIPEGMKWNATHCILEPIVEPNFDYGP